MLGKVTPLVVVALLSIASTARAHTPPLSQARVQIDTKKSTYEVHFDCDVTAFIMGAERGEIGDELAARLEVMSEVELTDEVARKREWFAGQLEVYINREITEPDAIDFPANDVIREVFLDPSGDVISGQATVTIRGKLPEQTRTLHLCFPGEFGIVILTGKRDDNLIELQILYPSQPSAAIAIAETLSPQDTAPLKRPDGRGSETESSGGGIPPEITVAGKFIALGFWHIIPTGPDHILFVLGLFLLSPTMKPLLWQVTAFTLAHSLTLALAMTGKVSLPTHIVEPLIAASIAFIAIENIFTTKLQPWRPIVVFAFGLLHGLGFAGVLSGLKLPDGQFVPALVGFNIGVEMGQLAVIATAFLLVGWWRNRPAYRWSVIIPASLAIAAVGIYWTISRILTGEG